MCEVVEISNYDYHRWPDPSVIISWHGVKQSHVVIYSSISNPSKKFRRTVKWEGKVGPTFLNDRSISNFY